MFCYGRYWFFTTAKAGNHPAKEVAGHKQSDEVVFNGHDGGGPSGYIYPVYWPV